MLSGAKPRSGAEGSVAAEGRTELKKCYDCRDCQPVKPKDWVGPDTYRCLKTGKALGKITDILHRKCDVEAGG